MSGKEALRRLQCRGADTSPTNEVPLDSSGERDFMRERVALFAKATLVASLGFFLAGFLIEALWPPRVGTTATLSRPDILFHPAPCAVLAVVWLASRKPGLSESALHVFDSAGTVIALALYALMAASMPRAWRPQMLF